MTPAKNRSPEWLEYRSQQLQKKVAKTLRESPEKLWIAQENLERWRDENRKWGRHTPYMLAWQKAINEGVEACCLILEDTTEKTQGLRSSAPFAGVLTEKERMDLLTALEKLP